MKTTNTLALSALLTSLVAAVPTLNRKHGHAHLHKKRELVVETHLVVETVYSTTTIWVDPTPSVAAVTTSVGGLFYEHHSSHISVPDYTPPVVVPSSSSVYVAPPAPSSSSVYVAPPAPTSVYTPPPAPSTSSVYVAPAPSSVYVAPSSAAAPAPSPTAAYNGGANGKTTYTGDITYYNPAGGYGACGTNIADSDHVVAIAHDTWDSKGTMSNGNPWCGQAIKILNKKTGISYDATIGDKCMGTVEAPCTGGNIDLPQGFFDIAFKGIDGRGHEEWFEWWEV